MTDDIWRDADRDDVRRTSRSSTSTSPLATSEAVDDGLTFGASDTGSLPHWTEPPTGEVPRPTSTADGEVAEPGATATTTSSTCGRRSRPSPRCGRTIRRPNRGHRRRGQRVRRTGQHDVIRAASHRRVRRGHPRAEPDHDRHRSVGHAPPPTGADRPPPWRPTGWACRQQPALGGAASRVATCRSRSPSVCLIAAVFLAALMYRPLGGDRDDHRHPRPGRRRVLRQGHREGLPAGGRPRHRHVRRGAARRLLARRAARSRS